MGRYWRQKNSLKPARGVSHVASIEAQRAPYAASSPEELDRVLRENKESASRLLEKLDRMNYRQV